LQPAKVAVCLLFNTLNFKIMAKRSHKRKHHHRRRRVGAVALSPSSTMVKLGSVALGYFLEPKITPMVQKLTGTLDAKIVGGVEAGVGTLLLMGKLGKRRPGMIATVTGGILAGVGVKNLLKSFGVVTGYGDVDVISGYQKVPVIGGYTPNKSLNGYQTAPIAINGMSRPTHSKIMGSVERGSGSGITNNGSELMG